jgi:hypothetical protein
MLEEFFKIPYWGFTPWKEKTEWEVKINYKVEITVTFLYFCFGYTIKTIYLIIF